MNFNLTWNVMKFHIGVHLTLSSKGAGRPFDLFAAEVKQAAHVGRNIIKCVL